VCANFKTANIDFFLHRANYFVKNLCLTYFDVTFVLGIKVDIIVSALKTPSFSDKMSAGGIVYTDKL
jgi:hypothetical protein